MIKIKRNDNIYDILEKISKAELKENISLEIPFWHKILYNYLSLKILTNKHKTKKIIITTTDINAKKIWKKLWIKYTIIKDKNFIEDKNILKYNYSFFEYMQYEFKKYLISIKNFVLKKKKNKLPINLLYKRKNNIWVFLFLLAIISLIFLYIFYFAVNKTYVKIKPEISVKTKSKNFTFTESWSWEILKDNENKLKKIEKIIYFEKTFSTSWIKTKNNKKSRWTVELINKNSEIYELIKGTRLLSKDWLLYEITDKISVPAWIKNNAWEIIPWIKIANIIAKEKDNSWEYIWIKWNKTSSWIILTIPWLKDPSNKIFAKTITSLEWWLNDYTKILTKKDLENAEKFIELELKKDAIEKMKNEVKNLNKINNVTYKILWVNNIFIFDNLNIKLPDKKYIWKEIKQFKVSWTIKVTTYAYNVNSIISSLQTEIEKSIIPEKENIVLVNKNSIRISNVLYRKKEPFKLKATISIEVFLSHNFEEQTDSYVKRLKWSIAWLEIEEATELLSKESKINDVEITIVPFFISKISNFPKNIYFEIDE